MIAEVGANHNRDIDIARELIDVAIDAGADAVKFQTYTGSRIYSSKTPKFEYLKEISDKPPADLLEEISLPREWQPELAAYAEQKGIDFFSSPFDHDAVDELAALGVPALKIASFEIVDLPLIEKAASTGIPLIISTGMASLGEIEDALGAARAAGGDRRGVDAVHVRLPGACREHQPQGNGHDACCVWRPDGPFGPHHRHQRGDRRRGTWRRIHREALHARSLDEGPRPSVRNRTGRA